MNIKKKMGDLLIDVGLISKEQLNSALQLQKVTAKKLGEVLIEEGFIEEKQMIEVLELQLGIPHIDLDKYYIHPEVPRLISERLAKRHILIPIKKEKNTLMVTMWDPLNILAIDDVKIATGLEIQPAISSKQEILNAIDRYYGKESAEQALKDFNKEYEENNMDPLINDHMEDINNAPMVRLVNSIVKQAVKLGASDIHFEPTEKNLRVRFRIDGDLQEMMSIAKSAYMGIVSRIKVIGQMNIAEKRIPQDGRVEMVIDNKDIDMRISVLPTIHGEKVVIRLLDQSNFLFSKKTLGFTEKNLNLFDKIIKNPYGIILVTGPTGSGKTTTLYATLKELNQINKNIITVEDPVEYGLDGISQVQVNHKAGLDFSNALRAILRQDPDIIMIGEIRDHETTQIAVRSAITGHLVLSTIHTNDTASTIIRLMDMGIEPYLISSSIVGIISQRLVKKICNNCKENYVPNPWEKNILGVDNEVLLYRGRGCKVCNNTGYSGRIAVHEIMKVDESLRLLIDQRAGIDQIRKESLNNGMISLKENCKQLVLKGITTVDELTRIAYGLE